MNASGTNFGGGFNSNIKTQANTDGSQRASEVDVLSIMERH